MTNTSDYILYGVYYVTADNPVTGALTITDINNTIAAGACGVVTAPQPFSILAPIQITAVATCTSSVADNEYYVAVSAISGGTAPI
ncbi:MAG: hypothetical protein H6554_03985 [Chitinophagales bacterium]|nr:hypothetical protein [Chitinophagales bacterium]